jgi:hypothetical protein
MNKSYVEIICLCFYIVCDLLLHVDGQYCFCMCGMGRAMAQAVSHQPVTAEA